MTALLFELTLTRFWDFGLFGFVLEPTSHGAMITELSPGMPAELDGTLHLGDVLIGAAGLPDGLFDPHELDVCTALDEVPSGMELTERVWLPRGLHVSYRSVRLVVRRTPPLEIATDGLVRGPVGDWQPVRLHMRREHGSSDLVLREAATEPQSGGFSLRGAFASVVDGLSRLWWSSDPPPVARGDWDIDSEGSGRVLQVVRGRQVILSRLARRGTMVELTVMHATHRPTGEGLPVTAEERAAFRGGSLAEDMTLEDLATLVEKLASAKEGGAETDDLRELARESMRVERSAADDESAVPRRADDAKEDRIIMGGNTTSSADSDANATSSAAVHAATCEQDDPLFFDQDGDDCRAYALRPDEWWVLANENLLAYDASGLHGLGEARRTLRVMDWRVEYRPAAASGSASRKGGLVFTMCGELDDEIALQPVASNASWHWIASLSRLPTHRSALDNLVEADALAATARLLWEQPWDFVLYVVVLMTPLMTLLLAWVASSVYMVSVCLWVGTAWSWGSMMELACCALFDFDTATLTVQIVLGLAFAIEFSLFCFCRGGADAAGRRPRAPAIVDTLHDRLVRESGTVLTLLTIGSVLSSDGLSGMLAWHMQWQLAMATLREFRRTRDGLRAWRAGDRGRGGARGTWLQRVWRACRGFTWRLTKRVGALIGFVLLLMLLRFAVLVLWASFTIVAEYVETAFEWIEGAASRCAGVVAELPGARFAHRTVLAPLGQYMPIVSKPISGFPWFATSLLVHNAYRIAQFVARVLLPNDWQQRFRWPHHAERAWCSGFVGAVLLTYFQLLEPMGAARARLREVLLVAELTLPWFEVEGLVRLRGQTRELAQRLRRRVTRKAVPMREPELGDTCAICCEPLRECRLRLKPNVVGARAHSRQQDLAAAIVQKMRDTNPEFASLLEQQADAAPGVASLLEQQAEGVCLGVSAKVSLHAPELDYCKWGCGRAFHRECSDEWRAHRNECCLCGSFWS